MFYTNIITNSEYSASLVSTHLLLDKGFLAEVNTSWESIVQKLLVLAKVVVVSLNNPLRFKQRLIIHPSTFYGFEQSNDSLSKSVQRLG